MSGFARLSVLSVVAGVLTLASGCGPSDSPSAKGSSPSAAAPQQAGPWLLRYATKCAGGGAPEQCPGTFGFSLTQKGEFEVGPGPHGQSYDGRLSAEELAAIAALLAHPSPGVTSSDDCPDPADSRFSNETVRIDRHGQVSSSCDPALASELRGLVSRYVPATFPNPCIDARMALEELYRPLTLCKRNSECAYLDAEYLPINPALGGERVIADDCTFAPALPAANSFDAVTNQLELITKRQLVKQVCGNALARPACSGTLGFDARGPAPQCSDGVCRVNAAIVLK